MLIFAALTTVNYATRLQVSIIFLIFFGCLQLALHQRVAISCRLPAAAPTTKILQENAAPSSARMGRIVGLFQPFRGDMRVDLGGNQMRVPQ